REKMRDDRLAVLLANIENETIARHRKMQRVGAAVIARGREEIPLEQVVDRDLPLMLDVRIGAADCFLVERDGDEALSCGSGFCRAHCRWRRIATERACASRPSASASAMAAGASARNCSGPHLSSDVRFMKSSTPRPEEKRAERAVGKTWLD